MSKIRWSAGIVVIIAVLLSAIPLSQCEAGVLWRENGVELRGAGVAGHAYSPQSAYDGLAGAFVTWYDGRSGRDEVYLHRLLTDGSVPAGWTANGTALRSGITGGARDPRVIADGSGGAIVVWKDLRSGVRYEIYAKRLLANGTTAPGWAANGVAVRSGISNDTQDPRIVSDGSGGAIVTWEDYRDGRWDIYAQRILSNGAIAPGWPVNGSALRSGVSDNAFNPELIPCGPGGAIVTWQDRRSGQWNVYVQKVSGSGVPQWGASGTKLRGTGITGDAWYPIIVSDDSSGALVTWMDSRSGVYDVYASRVLSSGIFSADWGPNGKALRSGVPGSAERPKIAKDGLHGAYVTWNDNRGAAGSNVYLQRVQGDGSPAPGWAANGVAMRALGPPSYTTDPQVISDDDRGAIVAWHDRRTAGKYCPYVQSISPSGTSRYAADGVSLRSASLSGETGWLAMAPDSMHGSFVTWLDMRSGRWDVYSQRFLTETPTVVTDGATTSSPTSATLHGRITDTGGENATSRGFIYREAGSGPWTSVMTAGSFGTGGFSHTVTGLTTGRSYQFQALAGNREGTGGGSFITFTAGSGTPSTWYLAEGSTAWMENCSEYISVENPNSTAVHARLTYNVEGASSVAGPVITLPAKSQATVNPATTLGRCHFSARVECTEGQAIAVDRTMTWNNGSGEEAHCAVGVTAPATTWYLPEGSSNWGFETWTLIQNPGGAPAAVRLTYMTDTGESIPVDHTITPNSRASFSMQREIGSRDASIMVTSDVPVIAERSMYRNNRREGHASTGVTSAAPVYLLAEGTIGWGFTTYVLVQNPNPVGVEVTATYMTERGDIQKSFYMPPNSRRTINVNREHPDMPHPDFSTRVSCSQPIIAERAMYWNGGPDGAEACHDSVGMSRAHTTFYFPDGQASDGRETWTLVMNGNDFPVEIEVSYLREGGGVPTSFRDTLDANSRRSYNMAARGVSGRASVLVTARTPGRPIMCERAMYWNSRGAGTGTIGGYSD